VGLPWYDEAFTVAISNHPLLTTLEAIRGDVHPPLWYLIEWINVHLFGTGAVALRLPAALAGTAAVVELYELVKRVAPEKAARWAGVLMAIMPGQIYYAQEARMYSLLTLLVLMGARAVMDRNWLRLGLVLPLILYTQNLGYVYVIVLAAWGLIVGRLAAFKRLAAGGVTYLPWLLVALQQVAQVNKGFWLSYRDSLGAPLYMLSFTTVFTRLPKEFYIHGIALSIIVTAVALIFLWGNYRRFAPLMILTFAPPAVLYLVSMIWRPVLLDRGLLPSGAMLLALWGAGLSRMTGWPRRALAAVAVPLAIVTVATFYTDPTGQRPGRDPIADTLVEHWQDGDAIYHITLQSAIAYNYYLPGKPSYVLPEAGDLAQSLTDTTKTAMGLKATERLFSQMRQMGYKRVWLFIVTNPVTSDYEISQTTYITDHWPTIREWVFMDKPISSFKLAIIDTTRRDSATGPVKATEQ
jgi:uncharacterized membrane protein